MLTLWKTTSPVLCSSSCDEGHNHAVESEEPEKHLDNTAEADMHAAAEGKKDFARVQCGFLSNSTSSTMSKHLYTFGFCGKQGGGPWFWARVRIGDLRYTQDSCRSTFICGRALADLQSQLGDDPDDVLSGLRLWPDVILHGDKLFSYDNRRAWAIKHCRAHRETRIWVRLYLSPHDFDMGLSPSWTATISPGLPRVALH